MQIYVNKKWGSVVLKTELDKHMKSQNPVSDT